MADGTHGSCADAIIGLGACHSEPVRASWCFAHAVCSGRALPVDFGGGGSFACAYPGFRPRGPYRVRREDVAASAHTTCCHGAHRLMRCSPPRDAMVLRVAVNVTAAACVSFVRQAPGDNAPSVRWRFFLFRTARGARSPTFPRSSLCQAVALTAAAEVSLPDSEISKPDRHQPVAQSASGDCDHRSRGRAARGGR